MGHCSERAERRQPAVAILMATYNGEAFLAEQLDSIISQTYEDWWLYIMDDMSCDGTRRILEEYVARDERVRVLPNHTKRGSMGTFGALMQAVPDADYYMFADQDDVWMADKVSVTLEKMRDTEAGMPGKPVVVHTDLTVVDSSLEVIAPSFWQYSRIAPSLLTTLEDLSVHNLATGCTMMFNRSARDVALPFSERAMMHDAWVTLSVIARGGTVEVVNRPTMLYRQHGHNVLGAKDSRTGYVRNKLRSLRKVVRANLETYRMARAFSDLSVLGFCYYKWRYFCRYNKLIRKNRG